jgi:hypothetical protein
MAIMYDSPVLPDDLTVFTREVPVPANFVLDRFLPNVYLDTNEVDIGELLQTNRTARFRAFDGPLHVAQRDTATIKQVKLPPLSDSRSIGELERLRIQFARTGGTRQEAFVNAIYNEATQLTRYVQNRMELARGDVLQDGKFTMLSSNGEPALEADFAVPGGNLVTAGTLWSSTTTADPLTDINTWQATYNALTGFDFGGMIINRTILNYLLSNTALRTLTATLAGTQTLLTRPALDQALSAHGLPPILAVYDSRVDVDGTSTRITPLNKVIFVPPEGQPLGRTVWGISATALELVDSAEADLSFEEAAGIVGVVIKEGPPFKQNTFVDAVGMPVIDQPRNLFVATVA